jgi:serine/threonine protein kinase SCH9
MYAMIIIPEEYAYARGIRDLPPNGDITFREIIPDSPFIAGIKYAFRTPTDICVLADYKGGGELFQYVRSKGRFDEDTGRFYVAEIILALDHLHANGTTYRHLRPENILLDSDGHIALTDFGLSAPSSVDGKYAESDDDVAPEAAAEGHRFAKMGDFWALGVCTFEMCYGRNLFWAEDAQVHESILHGTFRFPSDSTSPEGRSFVKGLLTRDLNSRLGAQEGTKELMRHPFFRDVDWAAMARREIVPPYIPKVTKDQTSGVDLRFAISQLSLVPGTASETLPSYLLDQLDGLISVSSNLTPSAGERTQLGESSESKPAIDGNPTNATDIPMQRRHRSSPH